MALKCGGAKEVTTIMDESVSLFTMTPMSQRFRLEPGQTYTGKVKVINPTDSTQDLSYKAYVAPYGVSGEAYEDDLSKETSYNQIKDWIKIENPSGTLKPNDTKEISFSINVPENAPAGGQYAAIVVRRDDAGGEAKEGVAVKDVFEMASIVYAEVNGETKHEGEILENNVPGFVANAPITLSAKLSNMGNVHENATIVIKATDFFTGNVIVDGNAEEEYYSEIVLPETTRLVVRDINEGLPLLGIVRVEQTINYNGQTSTESKNVIICPVWFLLLVIATLGAIVATVVHIVRKHRKKVQLEG